jgi:hypothetical protein
MTWYGYDSQIAIDQSTEQIARNAAGHVYATTDTAFATPLTVTDLAGVTRSEIIANSFGLIEEFRVEDYKVVVWKSGDFKTQLSSISGIIADADAARTAAEQAFTDLQAYIAANPGTLPSGRQPGQILGVLGDGTLGWVAPTVGGGSGILNAPAVWPTASPWPVPLHTHPATAIADSTTVGRAVMTAPDAAAARVALAAAPSSVVSFPGLSSTDPTKAAPGGHTHGASTIPFTPTGAISATDVQGAIQQAAATGGTATLPTGVTVTRIFSSGAYPPRGTLAAGTIVIWRGPVWPTIGGLYMDATLDTYLATP